MNEKIIGAIHSFKYPPKSLTVSKPSEFSNITATGKSNIRLSDYSDRQLDNAIKN